MFKNITTRVRLTIIVLMILASSLLSACDNGGTIRPDGGCIGQGASFDSCAAMIDGVPLMQAR